MYKRQRVEAADNHAAVLRQGRLCLSARLLRAQDAPLQAPQGGVMRRVIRESAACRVFYRLTEDGHERFSLVSNQASFEGAWD